MATKANSVADHPGKCRHLLLVSRRPSDLDELWSFVRSRAWQCDTVANAWEALERTQVQPTRMAQEDLIDLVLVDAADNADALHALRWLRYVRPELAILLLAESSEIWLKAEALRLGARGCLMRPLRSLELHDTILACVAGDGGREPIHESAHEPVCEAVERLGEDSFFVCATPAMQKLRVHAESLAQVDAPVLIVGEPGSGKESAARLIHQLSIRSGFPFIKVDCSAFPPELLEAELFGADGAHTGKLSLAEKGVIYLNDIAAMPLGLQARLYEVMQEKSFVPSGGHPKRASRVPLEARIMAATVPDAETLVNEGRLRRDLYYRLSAFSVQVPPLRQCREGIPFMFGYFISRLAKQYGLPSRTLSQSLLQACQAHSWHGNVSELRDFAKRYLVVGDEELALSELKKYAPNRHSGAHTDDTHSELRWSASDATHLSQGDGLKSLVRDIKGETEKNAIVNALEETHWNRKAAARLLRISYRALLYKIQTYGLTPPTLPMLLRQAAKREGRVE